MRRINVLDKETFSKIAAGEVVERASSVVKELVENSIDAGSKNITIEVEESGTKLIKISDDGVGIHKEDMEKAFLPHATSKIKDIDDIYNINSFGFRGEALSSIASVSKVKLVSKTKEEDFGKEIEIHGGEIKYINEAPSNNGTTIEVRDLFYNVPARQKFLKSPQRESSLISDVVLRLALANHDISFKLINNGKNTITTYGSENIEDTVRILYGKEVRENIIYFENHNDIASVHGYIGNREISRGSRNRQNIFVNKRLIKSGLITAAVENAFKSFLTVNKFPFFVLYLDIFPEYIDPNVHPTKAEIKFYDERAIFKLVFDGVHKALREYVKESFGTSEDVKEQNTKEENKEIYQQETLKTDIFKAPNDKNIEINLPIDLKNDNRQVKENEEVNDLKEKVLKFKEESNKYIENLSKKEDEKYYKESPLKYENKVIEDYSKNKINENLNLEKAIYNVEKNKYLEDRVKEDFNKEYVDIKEKEKNQQLIPKFSPIRLIGQFNNTYIIGELNNELILIDQHAAHEKCLFEKYKKSIENLEVTSQLLLTPMVLELSFEDFPYYIENEEVFKKAGFNIEDFGNNTISIREVPMFLGKPNLKNLFYEILNNLKKMGSGETSEVKYDKIASLACKAAVKANDKLSILEMEKLIEDLRYSDDPFTCPHGRPTIIKITLNELEKRFKRIQ